MKKAIEEYLMECGYCDFRYERGRKGWYIMARYETSVDLICIDIEEICQEILTYELTKEDKFAKKTT